MSRALAPAGTFSANCLTGEAARPVLPFPDSPPRSSMPAHAYPTPHAPWPELPLAAWQDTCATLHMWTQIVGKVRLALSPRINHWWEVALYVNARGLTTSAIPFNDGNFEIQFDFIDHKLVIQTSWGSSKTLALKEQSVADFYAAFMSALQSLGISVKIW